MSDYDDVDFDETTLYPKWADRPRVGDIVQVPELPHDPAWRGVVVATFYRNGEGGMHVRWANGEWSWASCHRITIVERGAR